MIDDELRATLTNVEAEVQQRKRRRADEARRTASEEEAGRLLRERLNRALIAYGIDKLETIPRAGRQRIRDRIADFYATSSETFWPLWFHEHSEGSLRTSGWAMRRDGLIFGVSSSAGSMEIYGEPIPDTQVHWKKAETVRAVATKLQAWGVDASVL